MKISRMETGRASGSQTAAQEKILPKEGVKGQKRIDSESKVGASPLEKGMMAAHEALKDVPDIREEHVERLKKAIDSGEYQINGEEVAEMMMRRLSADKIR